MKKIVSMIMALVISVVSIAPVANAEGVEKSVVIKYTDSNVTINGVTYTPKEFDKLLDKAVEIKSEQPMTTSAVAVPGVYFIPGVGKVLITATGVILVGGAVVAAGSWLGKKITKWFKQQKIIKSVKSQIPSRLKDKSGNVNLGKFNQKVKGKTAYKEKGGWTIDKDNAGHGGRKWNLKNKSGKRIGSLDGKGKVLGK